jgi:predicted amidohydrolase YtcJ
MTATLLRGGRVLVGAEIRSADLVVADGVVSYVGPAGSSTAHEGAVELDGALVLPAFVDGHVHATDTGLALTGLDLSRVRSKGELLDAVARRTRVLHGRPVLGHGWDESAWPDREIPTAAELDRASYGSVVYLARVDVHSALASSPLMLSVPGLASTDGYDGDGWLRRAAHHAVREAALGSLTGGQRAEAQSHMLRHAASLGIGSVHEMNGPQIGGADDVRLLQSLVAEGGLPEVVVHWGQVAAEGGLEMVRALGAHGAGGDLFVDGAIGSRTACLRSPYADAPDSPAAGGTLGALFLDAAAIADHLVRCTRAGIQAGFHVIGDAAMDAVVHGLRSAAEVVGAERLRAARPRLEHAEMLDADQIAALARLGVVASVQPAFDAAWGGPAGMYADRLGRERGESLNPYAAMVAAGIPLVLGSDSPVTPLDPWGALRAATQHRTAAHSLDLLTAFDAHTRGGHAAVGDTDSGRLERGAPATYAVWAADCDPTGWPDLSTGAASPTCLRTVVRGATVHDSGSLEEVAA